MKNILLLALILSFISCSHSDKEYSVLKNKIDSLENKLADTYKPGFGEIMSSVQAHHAKLWFAGKNKNWRLADFEIHEINELLDDVKKYQSERKESKSIDMINPAIDSVKTSIKNNDLELFKESYYKLTNACNNCHKATDFDFNVVKVPDKQSFSNQEF